MKNYACWNASDVYAVVNPDADAVPSWVFRAIHTDFSVRKRDQLDSEGSYVKPEEVLKAFLSPRDHALVPVIGDSGTGKSHLIRWLQLRLGQNDEREVIFVPKAGTNLRGIVTALIQTLPVAAREPYSAVLKDTGGMMLNMEAQRTAVLSQLQLALVNDTGASQTGPAKEEEDFLLDGLRSLFLDPYVRSQHFMRDDHFASDIAAHVFQSPTAYVPTDRRREFTRGDLPLSISSITKAAESTRDFLPALVADSALAESAVKIINRNLDWAIANCLNVTGDRLIELMLDIRRHIKKKGKELVLLIEDFARLQGLDRALLQSLLEQKSDLCRLRTAFATTTGFFDSVAPTVRTRLSFVVDLDVPLTGAVSMPLARVVSRYMNALRLGETKLQEQWSRQQHDDDSFDVESACVSCEHRSACHESFGEVDGIGLYPFTAEAVQIMAERADEESNHRFKLRTFQRRVLRPITLLTDEIAAGQFPPYSLLADLGGLKHFPATEENRAKQLDPAGARRRMTLLQLWKDASSVADLNVGIHEAFSLGRLGLDEIAPNKQALEPAKIPGESERVSSAGVADPRLQELEGWQRGQRQLSARTAQDLRDLVFGALEGFIDWDSVGFSPTAFLGKGCPFQPRSIDFLEQVTARSAAALRLTIPSAWDNESERYETLLALQGLLQLEKVGSWNFKDSAEMLVALHRRLQAWGSIVVRELIALDRGDTEWDPGAAAFDLRVTAAALTNPEAITRSNLEIVRVGLTELPQSTPSYANPKLSILLSDLTKRDEDLRKAMANRSATMKGGASSKVLIDGEQYLRRAGALRQRAFVPDAKIPSDSSVKTEDLRWLQRLTRRVTAELSTLVADEAALRRHWQEEMDAVFGAHSNKAGILEMVNLFLSSVGRFDIRGAKDLAAARGAFEGCAYDPAIRSVRQMSSERPRLSDLATSVAEPITVSRELLRTLTIAVDSAERELKGRLQDAGMDPDEQLQVKQEIADDLQIVATVIQGLANADPS